MNLAVDKALKIGVAGVGVRNSHHFGATGVYSRITVYDLNNKKLPEGWMIDGAGNVVTDSRKAMEMMHDGSKSGGLTPVGSAESTAIAHVVCGAIVILDLILCVLCDQWHYLKRSKGAHAEVSRAPCFEVQSTVDAAWVVASRREARLGWVDAAIVEARLRPVDTRTFGSDGVRPFP